MPKDVLTRVTRNLDLGHGNLLLEFEGGPLIAEMKPAQFFMIGIPGSAVLLRRPFSVCGLPWTFEDGAPEHAQVLYKVFGAGTRLMATLETGAPLQVLGPLGNSFEAPADPRTIPLFVAGGIGSAPFPAFAAALRARDVAPRMIYGARSAADLPLLAWFQDHCADVRVTTDDGSLGHRGLVTDELKRVIEEHGADAVHVYACGPEPMLKAVARLCIGLHVCCDLALEARMACGFGVCLGCVVPTHDAGADGDRGFSRVCIDGPVLAASRLAW